MAFVSDQERSQECLVSVGILFRELPIQAPEMQPAFSRCAQ